MYTMFLHQPQKGNAQDWRKRARLWQTNAEGAYCQRFSLAILLPALFGISWHQLASVATHPPARV
jgi:hypothetical protein